MEIKLKTYIFILIYQCFLVMSLKWLLVSLIASYSPNPSIDQITAEYRIENRPIASFESYNERKRHTQLEVNVCRNLNGKEILGFYVKDNVHHMTLSLDIREYGINTTIFDLMLEHRYNNASLEAGKDGYTLAFNTIDKDPVKKLELDMNMLCYGLEQINSDILKRD